MAEDKPKNNIKSLIEFRLKGEAVKVGDVVAKSDFPTKGDWQNLCHMTPPRAEETADAVGKAKASKASKALPG